MEKKSNDEESTDPFQKKAASRIPIYTGTWIILI